MPADVLKSPFVKTVSEPKFRPRMSACSDGLVLVDKCVMGALAVTYSVNIGERLRSPPKFWRWPVADKGRTREQFAHDARTFIFGRSLG